MSLQTSIISAGKERLTEMKAFLEEIELQMALGKAEAREVIEEEQKTFRKFINEQKAQIKHTNDLANEHRVDLSKKFVELEKVLSQELPTAKRKFDAQKSETLGAIYALEFQLKETYGDVGVVIQQKLDDFKVKLDGYRIQLALSDVKDEAKLATRKVELRQAINEIQEKMNEDSEDRGRLTQFSEEIGESIDHLKKAFSDLFS